MSIQTLEQNDGREGLFFYPKIDTLAELEREELALWLGRGAYIGWDLERRKMVQNHLNEQRAILLGDVALGEARVV